MRIRLLTIIAIILMFAGCANITTPIGGPKDITPPKLLSSLPENKQKNFSGKTVELTFDEMVVLKNPKEEIIISPSPGDEIDIRAKKNSVTITPKNGWIPNTTYNIQFREGIKDITEGNAPVNLKLAFSTGPTIDSLRFSGMIYELIKGIPADKITVAIYSQDTIDVFTDKPAYFTKTDKKGKFTLDNIKDGEYYIYAWDDKNKNLKVESKSERYGFIGPKQTLNHNLDSIQIGLVNIDARPLKVSSIRNVGTITRVRVNKFLIDYDLKSDSSFVNNFGDNQSEIVIWNPVSKTDSVKVNLTGKDSTDLHIDTTFYIKRTDLKPPRDTFSWSLGNPKVESETGKFETIISFNKPITYLNFDSLNIIRDTVNYIPITKEDITFDLKKKLMTVKKFLDKELFKAETDPTFILKTGKSFMITIDNDTSRARSAPFNTIWPEDTGIIPVEVMTAHKNYILQLISSKDEVVQSAKNAPKYVFKNVEPGQYKLRVIIDSNGNGVWDAGSILSRKEPERVIYYMDSEKKSEFVLRANWEYNPLIFRF